MTFRGPTRGWRDAYPTTGPIGGSGQAKADDIRVVVEITSPALRSLRHLAEQEQRNGGLMDPRDVLAALDGIEDDR